MDVISSEPVSIADVKNILEKRDKEVRALGEELYYEQRRALDHAQHFAKLGVTDTRKLIKEIGGLDLDLNAEQVIKFADLLPETIDDVRAIFAKERFKYEADDIRKILDVVDKYR